MFRGYGPGDTLHTPGPDMALAIDELYRMAFDEDAG
jgi:hypothetical protein